MLGCLIVSGSSVHGILQARILQWVAISCSRGSSWPRYETHFFWVSSIGKWILYHLCGLGSQREDILKVLEGKEREVFQNKLYGESATKGDFFLIDMIALLYEPLYIFKIMFCFFKVMIFFILISSIYLKSSRWLTNWQATVDIVIFLNFMTLIGKKVGNCKAKIL